MVVPTLRDVDTDMAIGQWVDPGTLIPAISRARMHLMPKQGSRDPWRLLHDYDVEKGLLPSADLDDGALVFK